MSYHGFRDITLYSVYCISSVCMVIFNKSTMISFGNPQLLLLAQMSCSVLLTLGATRILKLIQGQGKLEKRSHYTQTAPLCSQSSRDSLTSSQVRLRNFEEPGCVSTSQNQDSDHVIIELKSSKDLNVAKAASSDLTNSTLSILEEYFRMKTWKWDHLLLCLPISLTFMAMLITSLKALERVTVPTVVVSRNMSTLIISGLDYFFFQRKISSRKTLSLIVILVGAIIYGYGDIHADTMGNVWIAVNTVFVILNSLLEKYVVVTIDQTPVGVSCYQNLISAIFLTIYLLFTAGGSSTEDTPEQVISLFEKVMFLGSCLFGFTISISYFTLQKFASPTSISVAGNMNKFLSVLVGAIVFHQALTYSAVSGLVICILGGLLYSITD